MKKQRQNQGTQIQQLLEYEYMIGMSSNTTTVHAQDTTKFLKTRARVWEDKTQNYGNI